MVFWMIVAYSPFFSALDCCVVCCGLSGPSLPFGGNGAARHIISALVSGLPAELTAPTLPLVAHAKLGLIGVVLMLVGYWRLPATVVGFVECLLVLCLRVESGCNSSPSYTSPDMT